MKRYHRYLFGSVLAASGAGVAVFVFVLITGNAIRDVIGLMAAGRLSGPLFLELVGLLVPYTVSFALPLGTLIGILVVMGRLSSRREIVALKAAGLSLWQIGASVLAVALLGTALSAAINTLYAPLAKERYRTLLANVVREDPLRFMVPQTFIRDFPGFVIYAGGGTDRSLSQIWIWELDEAKRAVRVFRAESGRFDYEVEGDAITLALSQASVEWRDPDNPDDLAAIRPVGTFDETRLRLPLDRILGRRAIAVDPSRMDLPRLLARWAELRARETEAGLEEAGLRERLRIQYVLQRHFAMAFSILAFAVVAIPLGIQVSRAETYANMALALVLAMAYYLMLIVVDWQKEAPHLRPDLLVWLPNLLFATIGFVLWRRANRS